MERNISQQTSVIQCVPTILTFFRIFPSVLSISKTDASFRKALTQRMFI